ncbi:TcfC E-set like domain-containing protein [Xanthomonas sp. 60]
MRVSVPAATHLAFSLALSCAAHATEVRRVPPGFEDLVHGQIEQLDIRIFEQSAGLSPVRVTLDTVQLQDPGAVLQALELPVEARAVLLPALSAPLPRNSHLACRQGSAQRGCGYLDPPEDPGVVAVIHDEGEGILRLFPARQWLPLQDRGERLHAVSADARNALLHQQTFSVSGGPGYQALTAQGSGALGLSSQAHLAAQWHFNQQRSAHQRRRQRFELDSAYYRHDLDRAHYLQAGRMDRRPLSSPLGGTFGFSLLPLNRFDGVRIGSSLAYLNVEAAMVSTPLTVLLARDSRVDAFEGERLLQTFYLPAGIQQLDTRSFPPGSYPVTLRVHEDGIEVRNEEVPFEKGGEPTDGHAQWFVQAGRETQREAWTTGRATQRTVATAGGRFPLGRHLAMSAGISDAPDARYAELRVDLRRSFAFQELRAGFSLLHGSDGSRGWQQRLSYRRRASWNLHEQRVRTAGCTLPYPAGARQNCADSLSASMALPLGHGSLYIAHTRRRTWRAGAAGGPPEIGEEQPPLPPPATAASPSPSLLRERAWQASYSHTRRWGRFTLAARLGLWQQRSDAAADARDDRGIHVSLALTRLQRDGSSILQRRHLLEARQQQGEHPQLGYGVGQTLRRERDDRFTELAADVRGDNAGRRSASLGAQLRSRAGQGSAVVGHYAQGRRKGITWSATHSTAFALGTQGVYWGGELGAEAGLAVAVDAAEDLDLSGVAAELQVGGYRRQRLRLGQRLLVPLMAYQPHQAELQDASAPDSAAAVRVGSATGSRPLFLSPGRVLALPVPIEVTYTYIGRTQDLAGRPLRGARILNAPVPPADDSGGFVADFPQRETVLYLLHGDRLLHCPLRVRERRQSLHLVGALHCDDLPLAELPTQVRQQMHVRRLLEDRALIPRSSTADGRSAP